METVVVSNFSDSTWYSGPPPSSDPSGWRVGLQPSIFKANGEPFQANVQLSFLQPGQYLSKGYQIGVDAALPELPAGDFLVTWQAFRVREFYPVEPFSRHGVSESVEVKLHIPHDAPVVQLFEPAESAAVTTLTPRFGVKLQDDGTQPVTVGLDVCSTDPTRSGCVAHQEVTLAASPYTYVRATYFTVPAGQLYWRTSYQWVVTVRDPTTTEGRSPPAHFTTEVAQPVQTDSLGSDPSSLDSQGVNLFTGALVRTETDVSLAGPHGALSLPRTYSTKDTRTGVFGLGWSSLLDATWSEDSDKTVTIRYPDGRVAAYGRNPDGSYEAGYGQAKVTVSYGNRLVLAGPMQYQFSSANGRISAVVTGRSAWTVGYDSVGRTSSVTDIASGRVIYLSWDGSRISRESTSPTADGSALTWTYSYGANDTLTTVCDARGSSFCWAHRSGTETTHPLPRLTGVTSPAGLTVTFDYLTDPDRLLRVNYPGYVTWYYDPQLSPTDPPGTQPTILVSDPSGTPSHYQFNAHGLLLRRWTIDPQATVHNQRYWTYDLYGQLQNMVDENENNTEYHFDPSTGQLATETRYRGDTTVSKTSTYFSSSSAPLDLRTGLVTSTTDANVHTTPSTTTTTGCCAAAPAHRPRPRPAARSPAAPTPATTTRRRW